MTEQLRPEDIGQSDPRLAEAAAKLKTDIPSAYIPIELSTKGKLGAPVLFHAKNFSTENLLNLSLADDEELPRKVCEMLDDLIYEDTVSVKDWHEQEVIEFLLKIYKTFFTVILKDLEFQLDDEDKQWLANRYGYGSDEYNGRIRSIENKTWTPRFDINLETLEYYAIPNDFKANVKLTKKNGFSCTYSFPRYGDVVVLKDYLNIIYKEKDKQFASLIDTIKFSNDAKEDFLKGNDKINIASLPKVPETELKKIRAYENEKALFVMTAVRALHLVEYKGTDISKWPLDKKMEIAKDPELDYNTFKQVSDHFGKLEVGVKKEIDIINPIQDGKRMKRRYSFRLFDIFQALQRGDTDGVTLDFV